MPDEDSRCRLGWICPRCGSGVSPDFSKCPDCLPQYRYIHVYIPTPPYYPPTYIGPHTGTGGPFYYDTLTSSDTTTRYIYKESGP